MRKLLRLHFLVMLYDALLNLLAGLLSLLPFKSFVKNKKGFQGVIIAVVTTLVLLFVSILVMTTFISSVTPDTTWSTTANTTWSNVQSYSWTAIGLVAIGIIILGAVAILAIVGRMGGTRTPV